MHGATILLRFACSSLAFGAAALLAGCHSTGVAPVAVAAAPPQAPQPGYATQAYTPPGFKLPEGSGCSGDVARWRAIQDNDYASGNVNLAVYRQIKSEIDAAAAACAAGRSAEASGMIAASRRRHGYPE